MYDTNFTTFKTIIPQDDQTRLVMVTVLVAAAVIFLIPTLPLLLEGVRYIRFMLDHDSHYKSASSRLRGKVLAWVVPGRPITFYLSDSASMRKVFGSSSALDSKALAELLHFHGWQIPMGVPAIHAADKQVHLAMAKAKIGGLVEQFETYFGAEMARHSEMVGAKGKPMPLQTMGYRLIYRCVTPTVFGPDFPIEGTRVQNQIFAEHVHYINLTSMLPLFPYWLWNKIIPGARAAVGARDRVRDYLEEWETSGGVDSASDNYKAIAAVLNKGNLSADHKAKWLNTVQFGFLANTGEVVGWFLVYVTQSPRLLEQIRKEVDALPSASISTIDLKRAAPHLDSALHETLRLISAVFAGREVTKNTTLPGVKRVLPKGSLVRTMTRAAVFDTSVWGDDADVFRGDRFIGDEGAKLYRELMVFGGGASACPGRFFATHELQVVFATLLRTFSFGPITFNDKPAYDAPDGTFGQSQKGETADILDLGGKRVTIQFPGIAINNGVEAISGILQPKFEPVCTITVRE